MNAQIHSATIAAMKKKKSTLSAKENLCSLYLGKKKKGNNLTDFIVHIYTVRRVRCLFHSMTHISKSFALHICCKPSYIFSKKSQNIGLLRRLHHTSSINMASLLHKALDLRLELACLEQQRHSKCIHARMQY